MRLNADLKNELYEEMAQHAARAGRSLSDVVRELVHAWCVRQRRAASMQTTMRSGNDEQQRDG